MDTALGSAKIVVVDDERMIASTLQTIFIAAGYDCRSFLSAEELLERTEDPIWIPDFALLDVILPGMNGIQLAIHLRNNHPEMKITLFSGQAATMDLLECASGMGHKFDLLAKPVHPTTLLELIRSSLAQTAVTAPIPHLPV